MREFRSRALARQSISGQLGPVAVAIAVTALLLALLVVMMEFPVAASGGGLAVEAIAIDLKPEYDSRDVLVVYSAQIVNKGATAESMQLTLPVPVGARLKGVYEMTDAGAPAIEGAAIQGNAAAAAVSFATPAIDPGQTSTVYAMYYWDGVKASGAKRHVEFSFQSPVNASVAVLKVTEPAGGSDMVISPPPEFRMGEGTAVNIIPVGSLTAGQTINVVIDYVGARRSNASSLTPPVLGALMIALLGVLLWRGRATSRNTRKQED